MIYKFMYKCLMLILCVLRAFRSVLCEPIDSTVKGFTKNTTEGTTDTKKYMGYVNS